MSQDRYKTSIAFYQENWTKLQNLAAMQNTSPTAIINDLVDAYVNDKLPDNYEQRIEEKVYATLDTKITNATIEAIAQRVLLLLNSPKDNIKIAYATDATTIEVEAEDTSATNTIDATTIEVETIVETEDTTDATSTTNNNLTTEANNTTEATDATLELADEINEAIFTGGKSLKQKKATKTTKVTNNKNKSASSSEDKKTANLAKFKRYKASNNKKGYDDSYVAGKENLSKQTINRYRLGNRSPKTEFIERWGLNWNGSQWVKN